MSNTFQIKEPVQITFEFDVRPELLAQTGMNIREFLSSLQPNTATKGLSYRGKDGLLHDASYVLTPPKIVGREVKTYHARVDGMDYMRDRAVEELVNNGSAVYGLTNNQVDILCHNPGFLDTVVKRMFDLMQKPEVTVDKAVDLLFEESLDELAAHYAADMRIIFDDPVTKQPYCLLTGETQPRPLRTRIEDVEAGDCFLTYDHLLVAMADAHLDPYSDEPIWEVQDDTQFLYWKDGDLANYKTSKFYEGEMTFESLVASSSLHPSIDAQVKAAEAKKSKMSDNNTRNNAKDREERT